MPKIDVCIAQIAPSNGYKWICTQILWIFLIQNWF